MKRLALLLALLVAAPAFADGLPKDAPARVVLFSDGGMCLNAAASREVGVERATCSAELTDARSFQGKVILLSAGAGAVIAAVATVVVLSSTGHLR